MHLYIVVYYFCDCKELYSRREKFWDLVSNYYENELEPELQNQPEKLLVNSLLGTTHIYNNLLIHLSFYNIKVTCKIVIFFIHFDCHLIFIQEVAVGERIAYWIRTPPVPSSRPDWYGTFH